MNISIAGGGTGGHLFPGIALAQECMRRDAQANIMFIGVARGIEARTLPALGYRLTTVRAQAFQGRGALKKFSSLAGLPGAIAQAALLLKRHHANIVIGLGGYTAFPAVMAGKIMRIPTAIHEQNSIPGLSNRVLGKIADRVFVTFDESRECFPKAVTRCFGLPVRREFFSRTVPARNDRRCIFVCGGSQGARQINQAVMDALEHLSALKNAVCFIHQTGPDDVVTVRERYAAAGFSAEVRAFFDDMHDCYTRAQFVIARSGAGTLAEIALCGRASVLIPYPHATNDHQAKNAAVFAQRGAARVLSPSGLTGRTLALEILEILDATEKRLAMEAAAITLARPDAAADIVDECYRLLRLKPRRKDNTP